MRQGLYAALVLSAIALSTAIGTPVQAAGASALVQGPRAPERPPAVIAPIDPEPSNDFFRDPATQGSTTQAGKQNIPVPALESAAAIPSGIIQTTVVTVQLADKTAAETDTAVPIASALASISSADAYWRAMTNNRVGVSATTSVERFRSAARSTQTTGEIVDIVSGELAWTQTNQRALALFIPGNDYLNNGAAGIIYSNGTIGGRILMPQISPLTNPVMTHEMGHALGLDHANSLQCGSGASDVGPGPYGGLADSSCSFRVYGDSLDVMGISRYYEKPVISSPNWDAFQLGRGDEVVDAGVINSQQTFKLLPWAGTAAARAVKFTDAISGEVYYLELRTPVGFDAVAAKGGNRGVKVVQRGGGNSTIELPYSTLPFLGNFNSKEAWPAGSTFTTHAGTSVRVDSLDDTSAIVTVRPRVNPAIGNLDAVSLAWVGDKAVLNVRGWAYDTVTPSISSQVHVYITPPGGPQDAGQAVLADLPRADVNQILNVPGNHGFSRDFQFSAAGTYTVCVYAIGLQANTGLGCRTLTLSSLPTPIGFLESLTVAKNGSTTVLAAQGWTVDPGSPATSIPVHLYVTAPDGTTTGTPYTANIPRSDVNSIVQVPGDHGFKVNLPLTAPGQYTVCAYGISVSPFNAGNAALGCKTLQVP